jgi:drug/metabolite transporter (DMT)-like permease
MITLSDYIRLITLGAIFGSSFLFIRISIPVLGPEVFMFGRILEASLFLFVVSFFNHKKLNFLTYWRQYFIIGFFDIALPSILFGLGAQKLNASIMSVLNSTLPLFGFIIAVAIGKEKLSFKILFGILICTIGVVILVGKDLSVSGGKVITASLLVLFATFCYAIASNYIKYSKIAAKIDAFSSVHGSMWASVILMLPTLFSAKPILIEAIEIKIILALLASGILCSGIAYLLYFRLIKDIGPTSALTVAFLLPIFGILWGVVFLKEDFNYNTIIGSLVVLIGVGLVTNFSLKIFINNKKKVVSNAS